jgi:ribosomal protein S12 methylthiotransferase
LRIGIVTLGCDKNTVDGEYLAGVLAARGHTVVTEGEQRALDALVLMSCGFIESAREESLQTLLAFCDSKRRHGNPRRIVMAGCLAQRFGREMEPELTDVDAFAGVGQPEALADLVEEVAGRTAEKQAGRPHHKKGKPCGAGVPPAHPRGAGVSPASSAQAASPEVSAKAMASLLIPASPVMRMTGPVPRRALDAAPHAFLKIADGCDHACAFCAIPAMKGPYVSVPREIVLDEARGLVVRRAREIVLIAQDLAPYGRDLYDDYRLPELLEDLCRIEGNFRLRLLYFYPGGLTDRFLEVFAREEKICKYLDIPLQHLDPEILRLMRRPTHHMRAEDGAQTAPQSRTGILPVPRDAGTELERDRQDACPTLPDAPSSPVQPATADVTGRIAALRAAVPDVVVRTTMIVGFPGERREHFERLLAGVRELRFERLGAFAFSPEEGTPAVKLPHPVASATAQRRMDRLMRQQAEIALESQRAQIGRTLRVLVEQVAEDGSEAVGRSYREAPDVDGQVVVALGARGKRARVAVGDLVDVTITEADPYDLRGRLAGSRETGERTQRTQRT